MAEKPRRRVFGVFEAVFDAAYLGFALILGAWLIAAPGGGARKLAGVAVLVLGLGDAFHLVPRIMAVLSGDDVRLRGALGFGKLVTSLSMTAFYVILWHLGLLLLPSAPAAALTALLYALAAVRALLCLPRGNRWFDERPPVSWGVFRNIPFALMGVQVAILYAVGSFPRMSAAIALSFLFYLRWSCGRTKTRRSAC